MKSVKRLPVPRDEEHVVIYLGLLLDRARRVILERGVDGLRPSQLRVLSMVPREGLTVTALSERLGVTKQGTGQLVGRLVGTGHLVVETDPSDRRVRLVRRTTRGDHATVATARVLRGMERTWAQSVGAARYASFRSLLEELALR
jgi:DNA-binding MarR family transcriptional regulator